MSPIRSTLLAVAIAIPLNVAAQITSASEQPASAWPSKVVTLEELRPLTRYRLAVPALVAKGKVTGPTTIRVHVTSAGEVDRMSLLASCGNSELDETAMLAMRRMRFEPPTHEGVATDVTLVVPVHVPKQLGRTH